MSPQLISILALVVMFVIATVVPVNMGILAFVGAFLVGTLVVDMPAGHHRRLSWRAFPLVGITFLFAIAQNNGTIDWLVELAVRAVRGRVAAIPWIMFFLAATLTAVGAVSPCGGDYRAHRAGLRLPYNINPLMMGLMVTTVRRPAVSPISIYGGITNSRSATRGCPQPGGDLSGQSGRQPRRGGAAVCVDGWETSAEGARRRRSGRPRAD